MAKTRTAVAYDCECGEHSFAPLTGGLLTFVSPEDRNFLANRKWHTQWAGHKRTNPYARAKLSDGRKELLHRLILPNVELVDHADGNGLNNRRANLRSCDTSDNYANQRKKTGNAEFRGVFAVKRGYYSRFRVRGEWVKVGFFLTAREAAIAYDEAIVKHRGAFAVTNKSLGLL